MILTGIAVAQDAGDISCIHCHSKEVGEFEKSVHSNYILCTDCHGGDKNISGSVVSLHVMYTNNFIGSPSATNLTQICSGCHEQATSEYKNGIHWTKIQEGRSGSASCSDCHGTHTILSSENRDSPTYIENIPLMCSDCHGNKTRMQTEYYDVNKTDWFDTYKKSYHYKAYLSGGKVLASCSDCHESHNVKSEDDPESSINQANLPSTCGKTGCHPSAQNSNIYGGKVHEGKSVNFFSIDVKSLVTYFYILMILFELTFTFGLIFLGMSSNFRISRRKNHD